MQSVEFLPDRFLDSVFGDGAPAATSGDDNMGKLWKMVQDLKVMDASWHKDRTPPPTAVEQSLYVLILGHVDSDNFLFQREKNSRLLDLPEDEVELIVKELKYRSGALGVSSIGSNLNLSGEEEDECRPDTVDANDKLTFAWDLVDPLVELFEECRDSLYEMGFPRRPVPVKRDAVQSTDIEIDGGEADTKRIKALKDSTLMLPAAMDCVLKAVAGDEPLDRKNGLKSPEQTLMDILCGLEERRRARSYAPPVDDELKCYREIRKWVTSTVSYIEAKAEWLEISRTDCLKRWANAERRNYFSEERLQICNSKWKCIIGDSPNSEPTSAAVFRAPAGHKIAVVFEELPEFRLLLSSCKKKLGELMDAVKCTDGMYVEVGDRKRAQVAQEWEVKKKRKHDLCVSDAAGMAAQSGKAAAGNDESMTKTRAVYLVDIIRTFMRIGSSWSGTWLTSREVRLYAQIAEHVKSSIWLFHNMGTPEEKRQYGVHQQMIDEQRQGKKYYDLSRYAISAPETGSEERKTREQELQEIVSLVEAIKSAFFCSPPTALEMVLYEKISGCLSMDLMQSRCYQKQEVRGNTDGRSLGVGGIEERAWSAEEMALAKRMLGATCEREIELAGELEKEYEGMIRMIFTRLPQETKAEVWLEEHKEEAMSELKELARGSPQGIENLERVLLSLHEINLLSAWFLTKFMTANDEVNHSLNGEKKYQVPLKEACTVLRVVCGEEASTSFV